MFKTIKKVVLYLSKVLTLCPFCFTPFSHDELSNNSLLCKNCIDEIEKLFLLNEYSSKVTFPLNKKKYGVYSLFEYDGKAREVLLKYKMEYNIEYSRFYVPYIFNWVNKMQFDKTNTVFVPLPPSKKGYKDRGFDQCIEILKFLDIPYVELIDINKNIKVQQKKLNAKERKLMVSDKFRIYKNITSVIDFNRVNNVVLFDDVYTTGSSIKACINLIQNELKNQNINLFGLTLYRDCLLPT